MTLSVGDPAPDFTLPGTDGTPEGTRDYALNGFRGGPVVLVFYPGDNTPVCTRQLTTYTTEADQFADVGAQVLAISPQDVPSHQDFADKQGGFAFPLLADTDKAVGESYGVLGPIGFYRRSVFVVDGDGVVRYAHRAVAGLTFRPTNEIVDAVRSIG
ncbi:peroxiredoxin [Actinomarinicola tropica]|uniref:thioredoxin-dependent peroxiredoxin n=1 Tax=Actinomarinicola tropica TaxID=2789776 RepID=A0A5Q2RM34_9ACTN|nr:peroxiredoxin [Actinomarinicola tropica]QGG95147.1 redoxin domain-containing protein [Actinomarinicola tropica]